MEKDSLVHLAAPGRTASSHTTTALNDRAAASELAPCPFCGRKPPEDLIDTLYPGMRWREEDGFKFYVAPGRSRKSDGYVWTMHCNVSAGGCGATISGDSEEEARAAWNRRAPSPPDEGVSALIRGLAGEQHVQPKRPARSPRIA